MEKNRFTDMAELFELQKGMFVMGIGTVQNGYGVYGNGIGTGTMKRKSVIFAA